jgi:hypothetical protein
MKMSVLDLRALRPLLFLLAVLASVGSSNLHAQVASQVLVGTVDALAQDDGFITISGSNYNYSEETEVYLRGELVDSVTIQEGLSVRFSIDAQGNLLRIDILGPQSMLRLLDQN